jgi:hypothetical protein
MWQNMVQPLGPTDPAQTMVPPKQAAMSRAEENCLLANATSKPAYFADAVVFDRIVANSLLGSAVRNRFAGLCPLPETARLGSLA